MIAHYPAATRRSVSGLKIAYSPNLDIFPVEESVLSVVGEAVHAFEETGARVGEASAGLKHDQRHLSDIWMGEVGVRYAEITANFKREGVVDLLGEHREDLTPQLVNLLETGQEMSALDYRFDDVTRTEVFDAIQNLFEHYDLLVTPTLAVPPFDNADDGNTVGPSEINGEEVDPLLGWCLTYPFNFTSHPAASVPAGFTEERLPIGMQIVGRRFADETVLAASAAFERLRPWHDSYPR